MKFIQNKKEISFQRWSCFGISVFCMGFGIFLSAIGSRLAIPIYALGIISFNKIQYWDIVARMKGYDKKR